MVKYGQVAVQRVLPAGIQELELTEVKNEAADKNLLDGRSGHLLLFLKLG